MCCVATSGGRKSIVIAARFNKFVIYQELGAIMKEALMKIK